jgi:hypothetical protein
MMHDQETEQQTNTGGAAPPDQQCRYSKADGKPCRSWRVRGQDYCQRHNLFMHARMERPIEVPLLEDQASIVLMLSETMRALAWGTIPVSNGHALLDGCRLAHAIHCHGLERARIRLRARKMGMSEQEIFGDSLEAKPQQEPESECGSPNEEAESCSQLDEKPLTTPIHKPNPQRQFRDLKKHWDKELLRIENEMMDMHHKRYGETPEEFLEAREKPYDHLAAADLEVEKAHALATASAAKNESAAVSH